MATPANFSINLTFQDIQGFKALARFNAFLPDVESTGEILDDIWTNVHTVASAAAAMSNAKLVKIEFGYSADWAQEPTSESGQYRLVIQKARLEGGDGAGGFMSVQIPAPQDTIFLSSTQDNLIVVDPADSLVVALQTALTALTTPRGGHPFQQFFGGQLQNDNPRVRRVKQGS